MIDCNIELLTCDESNRKRETTSAQNHVSMPRASSLNPIWFVNNLARSH